MCQAGLGKLDDWETDALLYLESVHAAPQAAPAREIGARGQEANLLFMGGQDSRQPGLIDQGS